MARHSRIATLTAMKEIGLIPVFYNGDFEVVKNVASACAAGGAMAIEFTNRGDRAINCNASSYLIRTCIFFTSTLYPL